MTNDIDISPEAVGNLTNRIDEWWEYQHGHLFTESATTLRTLSEALEQSREECANLAAWQCVYTDGKTGIVCDEYGNQFCQQSRDLTQSRAETAAAYERAAELALQRKGDGTATLDHPYDKGYLAACDACAKAIRAITTTEQTAALDAMKAEALEQGMRKAAAIAKWVAGDACDTPDELRGAAMVEYAILDAFLKGGDA
jgi:hypothetical protein